MRRLACAFVLALAFGSVPPAPAGADLPLPDVETACDVDIHIYGGQFLYQTAPRREDGGNCKIGGVSLYTPVLRPAGYIGVPNPLNRDEIEPIPAGSIPVTYWIRNFTNHDPTPYTIAQCGTSPARSRCVIYNNPDIPGWPVRLDPGETFTFPPASNGKYGFPDTTCYLYFTTQEARWMRGAIFNEGWYVNNNGNCPSF